MKIISLRPRVEMEFSAQQLQDDVPCLQMVKGCQEGTCSGRAGVARILEQGEQNLM